MTARDLAGVLTATGVFLAVYLAARIGLEALQRDPLARVPRRVGFRGGAGVRRGLRPARHREAADDQVEMMVVLVSGLMRAGLGLAQAIESAQEEIEGAPLGPELREVVNRCRAGAPLTQALLEASRRLRHPDFEYLVRVIEVYALSGGNVGAALEGVAAAIREKRAARDEIRAGCADARLSASVIGCLPVLLALYMLGARRDMMAFLADHPVGRAGLAYALLSWLAGLIMIPRIAAVRDA